MARKREIEARLEEIYLTISDSKFKLKNINK